MEYCVFYQVRGPPECLHRNSRLPNHQLLSDVIRWSGKWGGPRVHGPAHCKAASETGGKGCVASRPRGQQGAAPASGPELELQQGQRPRRLGPGQRQAAGAGLELWQRPSRTLQSRPDMDSRQGQGPYRTRPGLDDGAGPRPWAGMGSRQRPRPGSGLERGQGYWTRAGLIRARAGVGNGSKPRTSLDQQRQSLETWWVLNHRGLQPTTILIIDWING